MAPKPAPKASATPKRKYQRIYINAGHGEAYDPKDLDGPYDPGAVGKDLKLHEAVVTARVARLLKAELERRGYTVAGAVRESFVEGATAANKFKANLCVSIHCNAAVSREAHGVEILYASNTGQAIAGVLLRELLKDIPLSTHGDGLLLRTNVHILTATNMPAVLYECGFLSNVKEEAWLASEKGQAQLVSGIADGIEALA